MKSRSAATAPKAAASSAGARPASLAVTMVGAKNMMYGTPEPSRGAKISRVATTNNTVVTATRIAEHRNTGQY